MRRPVDPILAVDGVGCHPKGDVRRGRSHVVDIWMGTIPIIETKYVGRYIIASRSGSTTTTKIEEFPTK